MFLSHISPLLVSIASLRLNPRWLPFGKHDVIHDHFSLRSSKGTALDVLFYLRDSYIHWVMEGGVCVCGGGGGGAESARTPQPPAPGNENKHRSTERS